VRLGMVVVVGGGRRQEGALIQAAIALRGPPGKTIAPMMPLRGGKAFESHLWPAFLSVTTSRISFARLGTPGSGF